MMFIGNSQRPRDFGRWSGKELRLDYWANKKGWSTKELFIDWLRYLDSSIFDTIGRKILIFLENCPRHGRPTSLPELQSFTVRFIRPNVTRRIHPMDARIIAELKAYYRSRLVSLNLDNIDARAKRVYTVDVLTSMRWVQE